MISYCGNVHISLRERRLMEEKARIEEEARLDNVIAALCPGNVDINSMKRFFIGAMGGEEMEALFNKMLEEGKKAGMSENQTMDKIDEAKIAYRRLIHY